MGTRELTHKGDLPNQPSQCYGLQRETNGPREGRAVAGKGAEASSIFFVISYEKCLIREKPRFCQIYHSQVVYLIQAIVSPEKPSIP